MKGIIIYKNNKRNSLPLVMAIVLIILFICILSSLILYKNFVYANYEEDLLSENIETQSRAILFFVEKGESYRKILEIKPEQKAVIVSGFSETERVKKAQKLGAEIVVRKPYTIEKLGISIKNALKN